MSETTTKRDANYIGLWAKEDRNGKTFLCGSDDDQVYFVFSNERSGTRSLFSKPNGASREVKPVEVGTFSNESNDNGAYLKLNNMYIYPNERRTLDKHPQFNLVIYDDAQTTNITDEETV